MRICMFAMLLPEHVKGGMEYHCLDLAKTVSEKGHDVTIITTRHPLGKTEDKLGDVKIYYTDCDPTSRKTMGY